VDDSFSCYDPKVDGITNVCEKQFLRIGHLPDSGGRAVPKPLHVCCLVLPANVYYLREPKEFLDRGSGGNLVGMGPFWRILLADGHDNNIPYLQNDEWKSIRGKYSVHTNTVRFSVNHNRFVPLRPRM